MNLLTPLSAVGHSKRHETELDWYYNVSPSEMSIKSNFGAQMDALRDGTSSFGSISPDRMFQPEQSLETARRNRRVYVALQQLDPVHASVLEAAYTPRQFSKELIAFFGVRCVGVAPYTGTTRAVMKDEEASSNGCVAFLESLAIRRDSDIMTAIRVEAQALLVAAHRAFEKVYTR